MSVSPPAPEPASGTGIASTSAVPPRRHASGAMAPCTPSTARSAVATFAGSVSPSIRTSCGASAPSPIPELTSASSPVFALPERAIVEASDSPSRRSSAALASRSTTSRPAHAESQRRRDTAAAQRVHARLALSSVRRCGQSSRGPTVASTTGSRVMATSVETSGISIPP